MWYNVLQSFDSFASPERKKKKRERRIIPNPFDNAVHNVQELLSVTSSHVTILIPIGFNKKKQKKSLVYYEEV